ncbi:hypothetical protein VH569_31905 [Azospirillum sp. 11R-A]|uniref:hypothetical protein n=1 Tax=Azospirillum sp. 11R-A TaxID=3111634 RepID=UPI003C1D891E
MWTQVSINGKTGTGTIINEQSERIGTVEHKGGWVVTSAHPKLAGVTGPYDMVGLKHAIIKATGTEPTIIVAP